MIRPGENLSIQINNYLQKIVSDDEKSLASRLYTELSVREISPANLRLHGDVYEVFSLAEKENNLIISGSSGSGKTTALKYINFRYADKYLKGDDCSVPLYIDLLFYNTGKFKKYIEIKAYENGLALSDYKLLLQNKKLIFLFDGLDLLSPKEDFKPQIDIKYFISENCDCRFVISGRDGSFDGSWKEFKIAKLEDFNNEDIKQFIDKYIQNEKDYLQTKRDDLSKALKENIFKDNNEKLISILSNPMVLYFRIRVALENTDKNEVLPSSRYELYNRFIQGIFGHIKMRQNISANREQLIKTLIDIFFKIQCSNQVSIEYRCALEIASKNSEDKLFIVGRPAEGILKDIINLDILSLKDDGASITYGIHQSFQDYFSALKLKDWFDKGYDVSPAFSHPKWEEVVLFASEMFDCHDDFIKSMINSGELDIASKCAQNASNDVKEELCKELADKLDSRYQTDKIMAIENLGRFGELAISLIIATLRDTDEKNIGQRADDALGEINSFLFSWDEIPGNHDRRLKEFFEQKKYNADWVQNGIIEKIDDGRTIRVCKELFNWDKIPGEDDRILMNFLKNEYRIDWPTNKKIEKIDDGKSIIVSSEGNSLSLRLNDEKNKVNIRIDDGRIYELFAKRENNELKIYTENNCLLLTLNNDKTRVNLKTDNGTTDEFNVKTINGKLSIYGKTKPVIKALKEVLRQNYAKVREKAAEVLGKIKSETAVNALIEALTDRDENVRRRAVDALGKIKSETAINALIGAIHHEDVYLFERATEILGEQESETAVNALILTLSDRDENVRGRAADALGNIKSETAVNALIVAMHHEDVYVRERAVEALGEQKIEIAVNALITAMRDEDEKENVRWKAAEALGKIKSETAINALITTLRDKDIYLFCWNEIPGNDSLRLISYLKNKHGVDWIKTDNIDKIDDDKTIMATADKDSLSLSLDNKKSKVSLLINDRESEIFIVKTENGKLNLYEYPNVRKNAADALGEITSGTAINALIESLGDDDNAEVRKSAAEALGRIKSETAINALITALSDKEANVRWGVVDALGKIKSEIAITALITVLHDEEAYVRRKAADALGELNLETAIKPLIEAMGDEDEKVRGRSVDALGKIKSETAITALIEALRQGYANVRERAAVALGKIKSEIAINALIEALSDKETNVRERAAEALGEQKSETAITALIKALSDEDANVRWRAVDALGKIKSKIVINALIKVLHHDDAYLRERAADALGEIKSETAAMELIKALNDKEANVRLRAADALGKIKSEIAINALIRALNDEDSNVRKNAADALGEIKSETAAVKLITALHDEEAHVRWRAALALGKIKSENAINSLIEALSDEDSNVRKNAADALGEICTIKHKKCLKQNSESNNEFEANATYEILNEIEKDEKSKIELFQKKPGLREKSNKDSKNKDPFAAHPAEEGMLDAYIGMFADRIKSTREPVTLIDYGCGQGMLLGAMENLQKETLENISYIGVDLRSRYLFKTELNAKKFDLYKRFSNDPEFLKPEWFYQKSIFADYALMIHTLHELRLVDLVDVIYNITFKLKIGGRFFILEQIKLLEKEKSFVLWEKEDFEMLFSDSGCKYAWRPIYTKSEKELSSIEIEKVQSNCFSRKEWAKRCLSVYKYKQEKTSKKLLNRDGISYEDVQHFSMLYSNISTQIEEYNKSTINRSVISQILGD